MNDKPAESKNAGPKKATASVINDDTQDSTPANGTADPKNATKHASGPEGVDGVARVNNDTETNGVAAVTNGVVNGHVNGHTNGHANGHANGA